MSTLAAETKTRLEVLERKSKIVDRCKPQTDRKLNELNEKITMLRRQVDVLEGRFSALVSRATGASPLAVQERVKRLEQSVKVLTGFHLDKEDSATLGSKDWLLDRVCQLEDTVDDLQVDMRDNLPDGLNRQFCQDLCRSTIADYSSLERKLEMIVLDPDLETRIHLLESKLFLESKQEGTKQEGTKIVESCHPLISVSMLRSKTNELEEEINALRGDVVVALSSAYNGSEAKDMKGVLEKWKIEKNEMLQAIGELQSDARNRDEQIRDLVARTENLFKEDTPKRKRI